MKRGPGKRYSVLELEEQELEPAEPATTLQLLEAQYGCIGSGGGGGGGGGDGAVLWSAKGFCDYWNGTGGKSTLEVVLPVLPIPHPNAARPTSPFMLPTTLPTNA